MKFKNFDSISSRDEESVFFSQILQWICDLQTEAIRVLDADQVIELGQMLSKKIKIPISCDLDPNYRNGYTLYIVDQKFDIRIDISRKGGFFCLRSSAERSKALEQICEQISKFLIAHQMMQIPEKFLTYPVNGKNELGGEVTLMTRLFGEL